MGAVNHDSPSPAPGTAEPTRPGETSARPPGWSSREAVDNSFCPCTWGAGMSERPLEANRERLGARVTSAQCQVSV